MGSEGHCRFVAQRRPVVIPALAGDPVHQPTPGIVLQIEPHPSDPRVVRSRRRADIPSRLPPCHDVGLSCEPMGPPHEGDELVPICCHGDPYLMTARAVMSGQHTQPLRSLGIRLGRPPSGMQNEGSALILHPLRPHYCIPLNSTLYIFGSGPSPEDALVGYELERLVEGHHDTAHVIDVLPSSPV